MKVALFKSDNRFNSFKAELERQEIDHVVLDFDHVDWIDYDYSTIDVLIYFPTFKFSSNHPLALNEVKDNIMALHAQFPHLKIFPDPNIIKYYNDKYRQFIFLKKNNYPSPDTLPLYSEKMVDAAAKDFGFPMVVKNRFGAGGDSVFLISSMSELKEYYQLSKLNFFHSGAVKHYFNKLLKREFYYYFAKAKKLEYPLLSSPLLAQRFIQMDRDLKTVIGDYEIVEGHWRRKASDGMWKVNIDGGGIGEWSFIPEEAVSVSERLAKDLKTRWLNIDLVTSEGKFLITEFSPVWHHYKYMEKPDFVYKDDYNVKMPLEESLDLEKIIIDSLVRAASNEK